MVGPVCKIDTREPNLRGNDRDWKFSDHIFKTSSFENMYSGKREIPQSCLVSDLNGFFPPIEVFQGYLLY